MEYLARRCVLYNLSLNLRMTSSVVLDWQDERPPAPSFLRVLYRGRILQDDDILKGTSPHNSAFSVSSTRLDIPFPVDAPATIVHMSIRPGAVEDDVHKKAAEEERSVCCCLIS